MEKVDSIERKELLKNNEKINNKIHTTSVNIQEMLPNIPEVFRKNWYILQVNPEFRINFVNKPKIAFKRSKNIQEFIGDN